MKGSIFRAFESFVEAFWSENYADDALSQPLLATGGRIRLSEITRTANSCC